MGKHDPEGKRLAILSAALELMTEVGVTRVTHRAIAARAGVPLGATTYYFPTLGHLVRDCRALIADRNEQQLRDWGRALAEAEDVTATLVELVDHYLRDRTTAVLEYELYAAAARVDELRAPARRWVSGLRGVLGKRLGAEDAASVATLVDGFILQTLAGGHREPDLALFRGTVARLTQ